MRTFAFKERALYARMQMLEKQISHVRKSGHPLFLLNLIFIEEVTIVQQAKRERLPVFAYFSGKRFINLDDEVLFSALEKGAIAGLIEDTPLLPPFMEEAKNTFKWIP